MTITTAPTPLLEMFTTLVKTDGFTVDLSGASPTWGYQVSLRGKTEKLDLRYDSETLLEKFESYVRRHAATLSRRAIYLGGWTHAGALWLEPSQNIADRGLAIRTGVIRNQISIWDNVNACEIPTGGNGK